MSDYKTVTKKQVFIESILFCNTNEVGQPEKKHHDLIIRAAIYLLPMIPTDDYVIHIGSV